MTEAIAVAVADKLGQLAQADWTIGQRLTEVHTSVSTNLSQTVTNLDLKMSRIGSTIGGDDDFKENDNSLYKRVQKLETSVSAISQEIHYFNIKKFIDRKVFYFKDRNGPLVDYTDEIDHIAKLIFSVDLVVHKNFRIILEGHSSKYTVKMFRDTEQRKSELYTEKFLEKIFEASYLQDSQIRARVCQDNPIRGSAEQKEKIREKIDNEIQSQKNKRDSLRDRFHSVGRGSAFYNKESSLHKRVVLIVDEGFQRDGIFPVNGGSSQGSPRPSIGPAHPNSRPTGPSRQPSVNGDYRAIND